MSVAPTAAAASLVPPRLRSRVRTWAGIFAAFFTAQTLTQLLGIAAGLLFIRYMPVEEFALYTLATSVITFFAFVTDLGSTGSLVHFYHRAGREGEDFSGYVAAVLSLRRRAYIAGCFLVLALLPAVALGKGFAPREVGLATVAVLLAVALQIAVSVRLLALRLELRFGASYRAEVAGAAVRLLLAVGMLAAAAMRSWLGLLAAAAGSAVTLWIGRDRQVGGRATSALPSPAVGRHRHAVLRYLLPTLPSALYFAVQGPLIVWLAASFGASRHIAEVGALTRLGLLVGIFGSLTGVVFLPRLARIQDERLWRRRAAQFGTMHVAVAATLFAVAWLAPRPLLWILGESYRGLGRELLLVVAGSGLALIDGYLVALSMARGWTRWQSLAVVSLVGVQAVLIAVVPLGTTVGVLSFNVASATAALIGQVAILSLGCMRPRWMSWEGATPVAEMTAPR